MTWPFFKPSHGAEPEPSGALKHLDLHVPMSADGRTTFSEAADILDHLATMYAWHPDVYGFFLTRALQARQIDSVYEQGPDAAWREGSRHT